MNFRAASCEFPRLDVIAVTWRPESELLQCRSEPALLQHFFCVLTFSLHTSLRHSLVTNVI